MSLGEDNYGSYQLKKKLVREKLPVGQLEIGMYVIELDRPWLETPFLFQGFIISSQEEIGQLIEYCDYVYIDVKQTVITPKTNRNVKAREKNQRVFKVQKPQESSKSVEHYKQAKQSVDNVLKALRFSNEIDVVEVKSAVSNCVESVIKNPNALVWLTQIKHKDDYTAEHCVRVSILAVALGRELNLLEAELIGLGIAAMLHDVGKIKIPDEILNKEGALTSEEYSIMKGHTVHGRKMLMSKADVPPSAVDTAYSHHEQLDGKGYPRGLDASKIPYFARIVSVVDAYDAITSDRVYCKGRSSLEALRILYDCSGTQFDETIAKAFIKLIGVYPPGHIAELTNGEVGIILSCSPNNKLLPKLIIVRDSNKKLCREKVVSLITKHRDKQGRPIRVKDIHTGGAFGISLQEYVDKGLKFDSMSSVGE